MQFERANSSVAIDSLVRSLTREQVKEDIAEYQALLDTQVNEVRIHDFLANHSYFFNGILRLFGSSPLYSKVKLGHDFEVDFAWVDTGSNGPEWCLVEIEAPSRPMFTRAGDPSAGLTHAIQQVQDWHSWIHDNGAYAQKLMPFIEYPLGYIFIGRRSNLTQHTRKRLRRLCYDNRASLQIHTLDWFASAAETVEHLIPEGGTASWPLPMRALSHSALANGLPSSIKQWLEKPFARSTAQLYLEERLQEREYSYWDKEDLADDQDQTA